MTLSDLLEQATEAAVHRGMPREKEEALREVVDAVRDAEETQDRSTDYRDFTSVVCQNIRGSKT